MTDAKIPTICEHCGVRMKIKAKYRDKRIRCPKCHAPFVVRVRDEDAPPPAKRPLVSDVEIAAFQFGARDVPEPSAGVAEAEPLDAPAAEPRASMDTAAEPAAPEGDPFGDLTAPAEPAWDIDAPEVAEPAAAEPAAVAAAAAVPEATEPEASVPSLWDAAAGTAARVAPDEDDGEPLIAASRPAALGDVHRPPRFVPGTAPDATPGDLPEPALESIEDTNVPVPAEAPEAPAHLEATVTDQGTGGTGSVNDGGDQGPDTWDDAAFSDVDAAAGVPRFAGVDGAPGFDDDGTMPTDEIPALADTGDEALLDAEPVTDEFPPVAVASLAAMPHESRTPIAGIPVLTSPEVLDVASDGITAYDVAESPPPLASAVAESVDAADVLGAVAIGAGATIEPSAAFAGLLAEDETALHECDHGLSTLLCPGRGRTLVTNTRVITLRTRRLFFGIVPGADRWVSEVPLWSPDLKGLRLYVPSLGRALMTALLAAAVSVGLWWWLTTPELPGTLLAAWRADLIADAPFATRAWQQWWPAGLPLALTVLCQLGWLRGWLKCDAYRLPVALRRGRDSEACMAAIARARAAWSRHASPIDARRA